MQRPCLHPGSTVTPRFSHTVGSQGKRSRHTTTWSGAGRGREAWSEPTLRSFSGVMAKFLRSCNSRISTRASSCLRLVTGSGLQASVRLNGLLSVKWSWIQGRGLVWTARRRLNVWTAKQAVWTVQRVSFKTTQGVRTLMFQRVFLKSEVRCIGRVDQSDTEWKRHQDAGDDSVKPRMFYISYRWHISAFFKYFFCITGRLSRVPNRKSVCSDNMDDVMVDKCIVTVCMYWAETSMQGQVLISISVERLSVEHAQLILT